MKKTKVLTAVLVCVVLVVAFTACAGCTENSADTIASTSDNSIIGTWKHDFNNGYTCYYEFKSDGSYIATVKGNNSVDKFTLAWVKLGDNHYQTAKLNMDDFYLSSDGTELTIKMTNSDGTINEESYVRVSASEVPGAIEVTPSPTAKATTTPTQQASQNEEAVKSAKTYAGFLHQSRSNIIKSLEGNGFTHDEAVYGADNCGANWNDIALEAAKSYLKYGMSKSGLKHQLDYEGFTSSEIDYAMKNCVANWNEQATIAAIVEVGVNGFLSRSGLIEYLESKGFTHDQAVYGVTKAGY